MKHGKGSKGGGKAKAPQYPANPPKHPMRASSQLDKSGFAKAKPALAAGNNPQFSGPRNRGEGVVG